MVYEGLILISTMTIILTESEFVYAGGFEGTEFDAGYRIGSHPGDITTIPADFDTEGWAGWYVYVGGRY